MPLGSNNEAILVSFEEKALDSKAKFASKCRTKIVVSPCEVTFSSEAILASLTAKKIVIFKAKPKAS